MDAGRDNYEGTVIGGEQISGNVSAAEGAPLAEVSVSVLGTGAAAETDQQGDYSMGVDLQSTDVQLDFRADFFDVSLIIQDFPVTADGAAVSVVIDTVRRMIVSWNVQIIGATNSGIRSY